MGRYRIERSSNQVGGGVRATRMGNPHPDELALAGTLAGRSEIELLTGQRQRHLSAEEDRNTVTALLSRTVSLNIKSWSASHQERDGEVWVMATVENVKLDITPSATKAGFSLIAYTYDLHPSDTECAERLEFTVTVGLWGEDVFDDDVLATDMDEHTVTVGQSGPAGPIKVERAFEIATSVLHEDLVGDDEVFLIVEARSGDSRSSAKSNTVTGHFR